MKTTAVSCVDVFASSICLMLVELFVTGMMFTAVARFLLKFDLSLVYFWKEKTMSAY